MGGEGIMCMGPAESRSETWPIRTLATKMTEKAFTVYDQRGQSPEVIALQQCHLAKLADGEGKEHTSDDKGFNETRQDQRLSVEWDKLESNTEQKTRNKTFYQMKQTRKITPEN